MIAQKVLWFQVTMKIVVFVHVSQTLKSLEHYISYLMLRKQSLSILHQLIHVQIQVLKNEVQHILFQDYFVKLNYVRVMQLH